MSFQFLSSDDDVAEILSSAQSIPSQQILSTVSENDVRKGDAPNSSSDIEILSSTATISGRNPRRKRKIKDAFGNWVESSDVNYLEPDDFEALPTHERKKRTYKPGNDPSDDCFKLIPLKEYTEEYRPPFKVFVSCKAMVIIDIHAHLWRTEVIGLLGGYLNQDTNQLFIQEAYNCNSISTTIQCEMDPSSEMEARDYFSEIGLYPVGWYHSHPTFDPCPSIRDIETQCIYQNFFKREDGTEPFVGIIVNPYPPALTPVSDIKVLTVSNDSPYSLSYTVYNTCGIDDILRKCVEIIGLYSDAKQKMNLKKVYMIESDFDSINEKNMKKSQLKITNLEHTFSSICYHLENFFSENQIISFRTSLQTKFGQ